MSSLMTRHTGPAGREEDIRNDHQMGALAGSWPLSPGLHSLHLLRYWRQGGSYLLLTLSWHSETSNCESKYSLHQENLPIMMGAGHYCDQLSHRSGKWDVINVAVNNNIRIYCGRITTGIEVRPDKSVTP